MFARVLTGMAVLILLTACAHLSVIHLEKRPWTLGQKDQLAMRYWNFSYTSRLENNTIVVSGVAYPVGTGIPSWASWIQDLWLQIYLSDDQSRVLAKDLRIYLPTALDYKRGVPFEFHLEPKSLGASGPLHVSFGYRMELTVGRNISTGPDGRPQVFFASQGALFQ